MERRSYLFDPKASKTDAFVYNVRDEATGRTLTYTLPCGSPLPCGSDLHLQLRARNLQSPIGSGRGGFGGPFVTCNKICTCIPVCQCPSASPSRPVVRAMAEQLLLVMGEREFPYMTWAADRAEPELKRANRGDDRDDQHGCDSQPGLLAVLTTKPVQRVWTIPTRSLCIMAAQMLTSSRLLARVESG